MVLVRQPKQTKTMTLGLLQNWYSQTRSDHSQNVKAWQNLTGMAAGYIFLTLSKYEKLNVGYWGIFNITYEIAFENNIFNY